MVGGIASGVGSRSPALHKHAGGLASEVSHCGDLRSAAVPRWAARDRAGDQGALACCRGGSRCARRADVPGARRRDRACVARMGRPRRLLAAHRFDSRAGCLAAGLIALLPYGCYQAYYLARHYTAANNVPSLSMVLAAMSEMAVVAAVLARQGSLVQGVVSWAARPAIRRRLGTAFVVMCAGCSPWAGCVRSSPERTTRRPSGRGHAP